MVHKCALPQKEGKGYDPDPSLPLWFVAGGVVCLDLPLLPLCSGFTLFCGVVVGGLASVGLVGGCDGLAVCVVVAVDFDGVLCWSDSNGDFNDVSDCGFAPAPVGAFAPFAIT